MHRTSRIGQFARRCRKQSARRSRSTWRPRASMSCSTSCSRTSASASLTIRTRHIPAPRHSRALAEQCRELAARARVRREARIACHCAVYCRLRRRELRRGCLPQGRRGIGRCAGGGGGGGGGGGRGAGDAAGAGGPRRLGCVAPARGCLRRVHVSRQNPAAVFEEGARPPPSPCWHRRAARQLRGAQVYAKSPENRSTLQDVLRKSFLFKNVDDDQARLDEKPPGCCRTHGVWSEICPHGADGDAARRDVPVRVQGGRDDHRAGCRGRQLLHRLRRRVRGVRHAGRRRAHGALVHQGRHVRRAGADVQRAARGDGACEDGLDTLCCRPPDVQVHPDGHDRHQAIALRRIPRQGAAIFAEMRRRDREMRCRAAAAETPPHRAANPTRRCPSSQR